MRVVICHFLEVKGMDGKWKRLGANIKKKPTMAAARGKTLLLKSSTSTNMMLPDVMCGCAFTNDRMAVLVVCAVSTTN